MQTPEPSPHRNSDVERNPARVEVNSPTDEIDIRERFQAIRRHWVVGVSVGALVFIFAVALTFRQPTTYDSTAKIVVASKRGGDVQLGSIMSGDLSLRGGETQTQVEIINSPKLIKRAYATMSPDDQAKGFGSELPPLWSYDISTIKDTNVILVKARAYTADLAARFANAISQTYLDTDLERIGRATKQGREYVESERDRTKTDLQAARASLAQFKAQRGIVAPTEQAAALVEARATLRDTHFTAKGELAAAREKRKAIGEEIARTAPEIKSMETLQSSPEFLQVQQHLVSLQLDLQKATSEFTDTSPEVQDIQSQIKETQDRLQTMTRQAVTSVAVNRNPNLDHLIDRYSNSGVDMLVAQAKLAAVADQEGEINQVLKTLPKDEQRYLELQQRVDELNKTYELLSQRYFALLIDERSVISNAEIAADAEPPLEPSAPLVKRNLALGLAMSLFLGVCAALLADAMDKKLRRPEDVARITNAPVLSLIPEVAETNSEDGNVYIGRATPSQAIFESFRMLRNNVGFTLPQVADGGVTIAVTSSMMSEGKSTVSVNLAIAMAMDEKRVLLVDADLRRPTVHKRTNLSNIVGLTMAVRQIASLDEAIEKTEWPNLDCLTAGPIPPAPTEFLGSRQSRDTFRELAARYDVVILDCPPCIGLSDMQVISSLADGVVMVVTLERTPKLQLSSALNMLLTSGANVIGTVINRVNSGSDGYYGYYSYYGYTDYSEQEEGGQPKKKKKRRKAKDGHAG